MSGPGEKLVGELASALVAPLVGELVEYLSGRGPEPPALRYLPQVSEVEKAEARQRARANAALRGDG